MLIGGFLLALPVAVATVEPSELQLTARELGGIAYLGLVPSGLAFFLWNRGATQVSVGTLAVMNNLKVPLAVTVALMPPFSEPAAPWPLATSFAGDLRRPGPDSAPTSPTSVAPGREE